MSISHDDVRHVARLARLSLDETEIEQFAVQMGGILEYVEALKKLDTDNVIPTSHAVPVDNNFRSDEVKSSIGVEKALSNAPDPLEGFYRVPKVIE